MAMNQQTLDEQYIQISQNMKSSVSCLVFCFCFSGGYGGFDWIFDIVNKANDQNLHLCTVIDYIILAYVILPSNNNWLPAGSNSVLKVMFISFVQVDFDVV